MAYSSDITQVVNPPLPLDPDKVARDVQVLKKLNGSAAYAAWLPADAQAENRYHTGDSPAVVELKTIRVWVEMFAAP